MAHSTPVRLFAVGLLVFALIIGAGAVTAGEVAHRQETLHQLLAEREPLADSAQQLYSALSVADASATTAFLSRGVEPADVRDRYLQAIGVASAQLVYASGGIAGSDVESRRLLTEISTGLAQYTGLVETARANNRVGYPVGAAYLGEASTTMQDHILPAAQQLHSRQEGAVAEVQRDYSRAPWLPMAVPALTVLALLLLQWMLARRTRRRFNAGLIAATVAVGLMLAWLMGAGLLSALATSRALDQGAGPLSELTAARITAQQARAEETLKLVRRDSSGTYDAGFDEKSERLRELLSDYSKGDDTVVGDDDVARAISARSAWAAAHGRVNALLAGGDYAGATDVAVGTGPDDAATQFQILDDALTSAISEARERARAELGSASNALTALASGAWFLTAVGGVAVAAGMFPRLREYL
nr:hypothetical protein [Rhodococcus sp. HNM0569]